MSLEDYAYDCGRSEGADAVLSEAMRLEADNAGLREQIADLHDRLRVLAYGNICESCGCAAICASDPFLCSDCAVAVCADNGRVLWRVGACISVGLRALCGRLIMGGTMMMVEDYRRHD